MAVAIVYRCKLLISKLGRSSLQIWCYSSGGHPQRLPRFEQLLYAVCIRSAYTINFERWWWLSCNTEAYSCTKIHEMFIDFLWTSSWITLLCLACQEIAEVKLTHSWFTFSFCFVSRRVKFTPCILLALCFGPAWPRKDAWCLWAVFQILNTSATLLVVVALIAGFDMFDFLSLVASDAPRNHFHGIWLKYRLNFQIKPSNFLLMKLMICIQTCQTKMRPLLSKEQRIAID